MSTSATSADSASIPSFPADAQGVSQYEVVGYGIPGSGSHKMALPWNHPFGITDLNPHGAGSSTALTTDVAQQVGDVAAHR